MKKENQEKEFIELVELYKRVIYKVCFIYSNDNEQLNDYYQEVVIALWKAYPKFRGDCKTSTWVYRIALFTCISFVRKKWGKPEFVPLSMEYDLFEEEEERKEQLRELYQLINQLGNLEKALILLWLEDKNYQEIAEITGLTRNNVAVKLMRIKNKLKTMYNQLD